MEKTCAKCQNKFVCNATDIKNCHCSNVSLTPELIAKLQVNYQDCLCADCLKVLSANLEKKQIYK